MPPTLKPIDPKSPRWEPATDPSDIVVPGLDTSAPVYDQIEQIEQLITIKLQNIDANFSKMQQIMANRILPAVKRYAVGTEPVREAAKFWTTFFEQAAQIHVPTYDDYSVPQEQQSESCTSESAGQAAAPSEAEVSTAQTDATQARSHQTFNSDGSSTEVSFMPGQAAVSSTPATTSRYRLNQSFASQDSNPTPSWSASLESPLVRLDREVQSLAFDDQQLVVSAAQSSVVSNESQEVTQPQIQPPDAQDAAAMQISPGAKGKSREQPQPLLQNVLRRNASTVETSSANSRSYAVSPLKVRPKTPVLKTLNPYLPPGTDPSEWKGVVDLADPAVATPRRGLPTSLLGDLTARSAATARPTAPRHEEDDSFDVEFGLSPPVTMAFARLPKLGKTPKNEAAGRIMQNLVDAEQGARKGVCTESSVSAISSPPSLARYANRQYGTGMETSASVGDASLDSIMRRVERDVHGSDSEQGSAARGSNPQATVTAPVPAAAPNRATRPFGNPQPLAAAIPAAAPRRTIQPFSRPQSLGSSAPAAVPSRHAQPPAPPTPESPETTEHPQYDFRHLQDDELQPPRDDCDEDSFDSLDDEVNNTQNPSAAFLQAAARAPFNDDSFESEDSVDLEDDGGEPIHPFARAASSSMDDTFNDSLDDPTLDDPLFAGEPEEETVFGVPPAQRLRRETQGGQNLRMMGQGLFEETIGFGRQMAADGRIEETPTPYPR